MIKVIAFDYGGVLGCEADDWNSTFRKVLEASGLSFEEMLAIWEKHWLHLRANKGNIMVFWKDAAKKNNADPQKLREIYNKSITINKEVFDMAKSLKLKFKLVILSNDTSDWMEAKIKRFGLLEVFDKVYCSANIGAAKPDAKIFEYVLNDMKIKPEEFLFIDNQENNIEAARKLGINVIYFENMQVLSQQLSKVLDNR